MLRRIDKDSARSIAPSSLLLGTVAMMILLVPTICFSKASQADQEDRKRARNEDDAPVMEHGFSISKRHGPWMILVSRRLVTDAHEIKRAEKAAEATVAELRSHGVPAYVVRRAVRQGETKFTEVLVLAGNYRSIDSEFAQKTLAWIQNPSTAAGSAKPHRTAHLIVNPLRSIGAAEE